MKTFIKPILILCLGIAFAGISFARETSAVDTTQFKVSGVCGMCKSRIENAALIKGVKWTQWDLESEVLTVIYRSDKIEADAIHRAVAQAGHDTEKVKATDEAYMKLPRCCAYRDGVHKH